VRGAPRAPRTGPGPGSRRERVDPWFLKPYEPTSSPRKDVNDGLTAPAKPSKQKLAFLLGGGPK
jgi:ATP-dependent RNA helicase RhlE